MERVGVYYRRLIKKVEREWGDPLFCVKGAMCVATTGNGGVAAVCFRLAQPLAEELGLYLWDVRFVKEGAVWYLRVFIDKAGGVDINDCVAMTRRLSPVLDEADPIGPSYCLEVSSPGIERELTRPEHFEAFLDEPVAVKRIRPLCGKREFAGILRACDKQTVTIEEEDGTQRVFEKKELSRVHVIEDWDNSAAGETPDDISK